MRRMRKWLLVAAATLVCFLIVAALLEPNQILVGLICGDEFYQVRPTRYWREVLREDGEKNRLSDDTISTLEIRASAIPVLRTCARDPDRNVRWPAIFLLGKLGRIHLHEVLPLLREALNDDDAEVRVQAILALARIDPVRRLGPSARSIAADLVPLVKDDPEGQVRLFAERLLWHISQEMAVETGGWQVFESKKWGFAASFPARPIEKKQPAAVGPLTVCSFSAEHGVVHCAVAITDYPPELLTGTDDERLAGAREAVLFGTNGTLVDEKPFGLGPINGREFTIEKTIDHDGIAYTTTLRSRVFWIRRRQYHIQVTYNSEFSVLPAVDYFLESFKLREPRQEVP
jgi:hypothetical protein